MYQLHCSFASFSLLSPSQGLLSVFCLQSFGGEPLTFFSVQGSPALTSPLLWLKNCESEEEVFVAVSKTGTRPVFVKSKSVNGKWWYKLHVWCHLACPEPFGSLPEGVKWILAHQPCASPSLSLEWNLVLGMLGRGEAGVKSGERLLSPHLCCLSAVGSRWEGFLDWCKFWLSTPAGLIFCLHLRQPEHALLQSTVTAAEDASYGIQLLLELIRAGLDLKP